MKMWRIVRFALTVALASPVLAIGANGYVDAGSCRQCHGEIEKTYRQTGMARSFSAVDTVDRPEFWRTNNKFYHQASNRYYTMFRRDGAFYMRRHQIGYLQGTSNIVERRVDFVVGSGNHARTFIHRQAKGRLIELPISWYSADGGHWGMSPGFDQSRHSGFRRQISDECVFCHAAYPQTARAGPSQGIDCQRCHGPGQAHLDAISEGASVQRIRSAIVNPARLSRQRQLEVCLQCHLESTSRPLPHALRRFNREAFSYRPGEPLGDYVLHFDHPADSRHQDKFEVNSAGYRFLKSKCFVESRGDLTCTRCHDPHVPLGNNPATERYRDICIECHSMRWRALTADGQHPSGQDCIACHMPKRRSEDATQVVITDHLITRHLPSGDLLAPIDEEVVAKSRIYSGPVVLYYPPQMIESDSTELYRAIAQVTDDSNLSLGIDALRNAISLYSPQLPQFRVELAEAYFRAGRLSDAEAELRRLIKRASRVPRAEGLLGEVLLRLGRVDEAIRILGEAAQRYGDNAELLSTLGVALGQGGRFGESVRILRRAVALNPDSPLSWINLGTSLEQMGDLSSAQTAYQEAIRAQPDNAGAHQHLANLLLASAPGQRAEYHAREALRFGPQDGKAHLTLGRVLAAIGHTASALNALRTAIELGDLATRDAAGNEMRRLERSNQR